MLRNDTFTRMDRNVGALNRTTARAASMMTLGPETMKREMLRNRDVLEKNARQVNEVMGDFVTLTDMERRTVGRLLFFYPYLHYVTRLVFYKLPVQHPTKIAIMAQIGRLGEEEQRELLGIPAQASAKEINAARLLMTGRVFERDQRSATGVREYNVRSANILGHPAFEAEGSEQILTLVPPAAQWAIGQGAKMDVYRWQNWNLRGEKTSPVQRPEMGPVPENAALRGRILLRQALDLPPITRELQRKALPGEQSSEANLITGEVPLRYKSGERQAVADERRARDLRKPFDRALVEQNFRMFVPRESDITGQLERQRKRLAVAAPSRSLDREVDDVLKELRSPSRRSLSDEVDEVLKEIRR